MSAGCSHYLKGLGLCVLLSESDGFAQTLNTAHLVSGVCVAFREIVVVCLYLCAFGVVLLLFHVRKCTFELSTVCTFIIYCILSSL